MLNDHLDTTEVLVLVVRRIRRVARESTGDMGQGVVLARLDLLQIGVVVPRDKVEEGNLRQVALRGGRTLHVLLQNGLPLSHFAAILNSNYTALILVRGQSMPITTRELRTSGALLII